jgi:hypothetical protein
MMEKNFSNRNVAAKVCSARGAAAAALFNQ